MAKFIAFDIDECERASCGIVDMSCALDVYPIPMAIDPITKEPVIHMTSRTWPKTSLLIKPGLTMQEVERDFANLLNTARNQYAKLERFADAIHPSNDDADAVWQARKRLGLVR